MRKKSLSPLRYPGGKNNLYSFVSDIVLKNNLGEKIYVEPFAGGFGLGLKLMMNGIINKFIINDYDWHIYAFWKCVFYHTKEIVDKIRGTDITIKEWERQREIYDNFRDYSIIEVGFSTLFLNRTNYSGIMKSGPIGGYNQNGKYKLNCRFNKEHIIRLIEDISKYKKNVRIFNMDAIKLINKLKSVEADIFYNFDPPYVSKGKELYLNSYKLKDHKILQKAVSQIETNWVMTYDDDEMIRTLYKDYFQTKIAWSYVIKSKRKTKELFISNFYNYKIDN